MSKLHATWFGAARCGPDPAALTSAMSACEIFYCRRRNAWKNLHQASLSGGCGRQKFGCIGEEQWRRLAVRQGRGMSGGRRDGVQKI